MARPSVAKLGPHSGLGFSVTAPEAERFWDNVLFGDGCWLWMARLSNGYGSFSSARIRHAPIVAHRVAWAIAHRRVRAGLVVMHICNNKRCVRPDHLKVGTQGENLRDAVRDGLVSYHKSATCLICGAKRSPRCRSKARCLRCLRKETRLTPQLRAASLIQRIEARRLDLPFVPPSTFAELAAGVGGRRANLFARYYGFYDRRPQTLEVLGQDVGLTRERVRQICERVGELMSVGPTVHRYIRDRKVA
jgi:hypothetical protein